MKPDFTESREENEETLSNLVELLKWSGDVPLPQEIEEFFVRHMNHLLEQWLIESSLWSWKAERTS